MNPLLDPHVLVIVNGLRDDRNDAHYHAELPTIEVQHQGDEIDTFIAPRRLDEDTDSLLVGSAFASGTHPPADKPFQQLQQQALQQLEQHHPQGDRLGQTWIVAGYLPTEDAASPEQYAQAAYAELGLGDWPTQPAPVANRLGPAHWYEVATPAAHVWLVLYGDRAQFQQLGEHQENWRRLLCYRHKILRSYEQTRSIKPELLAQEPSPVDLIVQLHGDRAPLDILNLSTTQIEQFLDQNIRTVAKYNESLRALEYNHQTIQINLYNYRQLLSYWAASIPHSDLSPLADFARKTEDFYLVQVQADIAVLSPELRTRESWISTIRGVVEIDRGKRDRAFQLFVESAGIGLGTAGFTSSVISPYLQSYAEQNQEQISPYSVGTTHFLLCLGVGLLFSGLTFVWRQRLLRSR